MFGYVFPVLGLFPFIYEEHLCVECGTSCSFQRQLSFFPYKMEEFYSPSKGLVVHNCSSQFLNILI